MPTVQRSSMPKEIQHEAIWHRLQEPILRTHSCSMFAPLCQTDCAQIVQASKVWGEAPGGNRMADVLPHNEATAPRADETVQNFGPELSCPAPLLNVADMQVILSQRDHQARHAGPTKRTREAVEGTQTYSAGLYEVRYLETCWFRSVRL